MVYKEINNWRLNMNKYVCIFKFKKSWFHQKTWASEYKSDLNLEDFKKQVIKDIVNEPFELRGVDIITN